MIRSIITLFFLIACMLLVDVHISYGAEENVSEHVDKNYKAPEKIKISKQDSKRLLDEAILMIQSDQMAKVNEPAIKSEYLLVPMPPWQFNKEKDKDSLNRVRSAYVKADSCESLNASNFESFKSLMDVAKEKGVSVSKILFVEPPSPPPPPQPLPPGLSPDTPQSSSSEHETQTAETKNNLDKAYIYFTVPHFLARQWGYCNLISFSLKESEIRTTRVIIFKALLQYIMAGGDINVRDKLGDQSTALHYLAKSSGVDCCRNFTLAEMFLLYGADPNAQDANGNTPLHMGFDLDNPYQTNCQSLPMYFLLKDYQARDNIKNNKGITPLELNQYCVKNILKLNNNKYRPQSSSQ